MFNMGNKTIKSFFTNRGQIFHLLHLHVTLQLEVFSIGPCG